VRLSYSHEERRVLAIVMLAFIPFALVVATVLQRHTESARAQITADRLAHARAAANLADNYIGGNTTTLTALSQLAAVQSATVATANDILGPVLKNDPNWLALALTGADGLNITSFSAPPRTVSIADRDYFQQALQTGAPAVGSVVIARGTLAQKTVVIAVPIRFSDGTRGVVSGALSLTRAEQLIRGAVPTGLELRIVDRRGQEFIGPKATNDAVPVVADDPDVHLAMTGGSGATVLRRGGTDVLVAYAGAALPGWSILVNEPAAAAFAVPERDTYGAVVLTIAGLAAALAIAWYFGRRLGRTYTALDRARSQAETERGRLREALTNSPARVGLLLGPDLVFAVVSPETLAPLGLRESDVVGKPYHEVDPSPERRAALEQVYRTGEPRRATEAHTVVTLPNGSTQEAYYNTAILPLRDADGRIDGVVYHAVDVTDLVRARHRVEELVDAIGAERDDLQQVINALPEGVVVVRPNGATMRNSAADAILGHSIAAEFRPDRNRTAEPRRLDGTPYRPDETPLIRALQRGELVHGEQLVIKNSSTQTEIPVLVSAAPVRREGEIVAAVSVFQDISSLKAIEAQRTEFFSVASHEIKTPITAIQLQLELAQRLHRDGHHDRVGEMVSRALVRTRDLAELVNDLLAVSRIDAGRFPLESAELDLGELARSVAEDFPTDESHPLNITTPTAPAIVHADRRRVTEMLENLLANAVKYSPDGGAIDVDVRLENGHAALRVRDRGIGVPPEERPYIFQRFFRTSRAKAFGGVGLGLYISREIAERHGGSLQIESTSESGSTFVAELPLVASAAETAS